MTRQLVRLGTVLPIIWVLVMSAPAGYADHLKVLLVPPEAVDVGDMVTVQVVVQSAESRDRIPGATVVARRSAGIAGFSGEVEVARALTDEEGMARLSWVERGGLAESVTVAYSAPGDEDFESEPLAVYTVNPGPQLERSESGVQIPGLGAWVLIGVLAGTWAVIQFALVGPVHVARLSTEIEDRGESPRGKGTA